MTEVMSVVFHGLGSVIGFLLIATVVFRFIQNVTQKSTRCCDRDGMPFNRAARGRVYPAPSATASSASARLTIRANRTPSYSSIRPE